MSDHCPPDITRLLEKITSGDLCARNDLLPLIYDELRCLARRQRRRARPHETMNTTALVHEAYIKMAGKEKVDWEGRSHFFRVAGRAMRDILVDYARRKRAAKRGGGQADRSMDEIGELPDMKEEEILDIHEALKHLETIDPRQAKVVELRYFVGLTIPETAEYLQISPATVRRDWTMARGWLQREIEQNE